MKTSRVRLVTITGFLCSIACVAILHLVRMDLKPAAHRLSDYAIGRYGWLMTVAFIALSSGLMALGLTLWRARGPDKLAWVIPGSAFLAAVGTIVSGMFRTGVTETSELIHSYSSTLAAVAVVTLALAYSMPISRNLAGRARDWVATSLALVGTVFAALGPLLHDTRWTGLGQRLLWAALIIWLLWVAAVNPGAERTAIP